MEVSMDTTPAQAQPQPQSQTLSPAPAPGTPRKRSLNEIDIETRGGNGSGSAAENQENSDPTGSGGGGLLDDRKEGGVDTAGAGVGTVAGIETAVRVEIPLGSIPPPNTNVNSNSNSIAEQQQGADDVDVDVDVEADTDANMTTIEDTNGTAATPASKKRKLSPASKETKQQEKEAKDRQRAEEKSKKEEEKAKREEERRAREEEKKKREAEREEEKRKREAEREEKKRVRDEERAAREEEKKKKDEEKVKKEEEKKKRDEEKVKKEEEKSKKEKAQMRLNAFFAKPKTPGVSTSTGPGGSPNKNASDATANDDTGDVVSDYNRVFPEFFLQSHTVVAPPHRFQRDSEALGVVRRSVDESLKSGHSSEPPVFRPSEVFRMIPYKRRWGKQPGSVKDILLQIQNMGDKGDAAVGTGSAGDVKLHNRRPQDLLNQVRMKSLKFGEDVRPPYQGTFTRKVPESSAQKISRNPFRRCLPDTNYDYDSEAEWEEPEEGEELDSEEEEEADDEADDDLEGFLDDDGDEDQPVDGKRRLIVGDLEPQTSGVRWQESAHTVDPVLQMYKIETISDTVTFPIDPFSTAYWQKPKLTDAGVAGNGASSERSTTLFSGSSNSATADGAPTLGGTGKAKRGFPPEQLAEFKEVVNGSDLTKMGLVEILKKRFPKVSKDVLKETLTGQATRVGSKESEKKWVCQ